MIKFCYKHLLNLIIFIGFISVLIISWQRHQIEINNRTVELVMNYDDITELAKTQGLSEKYLLNQFKQAGITTLAIYENTLEKLCKNGKITVLSGAHLLDDFRTDAFRKQYWLHMINFEDIHPEQIYIIGTDKSLFNELKTDLERRLGLSRVTLLNNNNNNNLILVIKANYEKTIKWNLGLPTHEMIDVNNSGFYVMARPTNYNKITTEDIHAIFERLNGINTSGIMFESDEVIGFPNFITETAREMNDNDLTLSMIEHPLQLQFYKQSGLIELAELLNYKVARVYRIAKDEQQKLKVEQAVHRWAITTDQERNIRVNLLHKYDKAESGEDLIETNIRYITSVKEELLNKGFMIGKASTFPAYFPSKWLQFLSLIGVLAATILLLSKIVLLSPRTIFLLMISGCILLFFLFLKDKCTLSRQFGALVAANIFPVLAMTWVLKRWQKLKNTSLVYTRIITESFLNIIVATTISLMGGFYVGALLSDVRFFLEIDIFRGVKFTFITPIILISLIYIKNYMIIAMPQNYHYNIVFKIKKFLDYTIKIKTFFILVFFVIVAYIYIGRSGHTAGIPVSGIELKLRYLLEEIMYARPRGKEFLIGHPSFFIAIIAISRNWSQFLYYSLIVFSMIGQSSIVETFAHIRTPIFISFARGIDGLILGIFLGFAAVIFLQFLFYFSNMSRRRPT